MTEIPTLIEVYPATDMIATDGAAIGEPISFADDLVLDDVYRLTLQSRFMPLPLIRKPGQTTFLRKDRPEVTIHLDCCLTLMTPEGATIEALIFVELIEDAVDAVYLLPLAEIRTQVDYRIVGVERHTATRRFAQAGCGSFASGTRITLGDGRLCPVEDLQIGDLLLTRDHGPQPLRWIGKTTLRAIGSFAPVVITKDALNNNADLVLRADHRLFVYQRSDLLGAGRPEVMIRARHLINDGTVYRRKGGYIDYFQLILDAHLIIYAEGICAESQRIDANSRPSLPECSALADHPPGRFLDYEVDTDLISPDKTADLLLRATTR